MYCETILTATRVRNFHSKKKKLPPDLVIYKS